MPEAKNIYHRYPLLLAIGVFGIYLLYRLALVFFPHPDAGGVENNVIWFIQRLLDGGTLYTNPEASPYAIAQYTPSYYYLNAVVARLTGTGPDDVLSLFIISRALSLVINILYAGVIVATAKKIFDCHWDNSIMAGIFSFIFLEITSFSRPDSLCHLFFMLSFYCFALVLRKDARGEKARVLFITSAVCAALALFSKQSALVLAIIYAAWFIRKKQYRLLLYWMGSYLFAIVILLFVVARESGLNPFLQNTVAGINNGVSFYWYCHTIIKEFYSQFGLLWLPALVFVLLSLAKEKEGRFDLLKISLVIAFLFSNLISLKWGSSPGYFTEWVSFIFIGLAYYGNNIAAALSPVYRKLIPASLVIILFVKAMLIFYPLWNMVRPGAREHAMGQFRREKLLAAVVSHKVRATPGHTVFNNIYSPELYLNNLLFRHCVMPQFEIVAFGTWKNKVFDYSKFRQEITDGTVQMVLCKPGSQLQFMDIPLVKFTLLYTYFTDYYIYEYKP